MNIREMCDAAALYMTEANSRRPIQQMEKVNYTLSGLAILADRFSEKGDPIFLRMAIEAAFVLGYESAKEVN